MFMLIRAVISNIAYMIRVRMIRLANAKKRTVMVMRVCVRMGMFMGMRICMIMNFFLVICAAFVCMGIGCQSQNIEHEKKGKCYKDFISIIAHISHNKILLLKLLYKAKNNISLAGDVILDDIFYLLYIYMQSIKSDE